jgi:hypothetical protein
MTKIEIDIRGDATLSEVLHSIEALSGKICSFEAEGPGGGNPCLILEFPDDERAARYVASVYEEYDDKSLHALLDIHKIPTL